MIYEYMNREINLMCPDNEFWRCLYEYSNRPYEYRRHLNVTYYFLFNIY